MFLSNAMNSPGEILTMLLSYYTYIEYFYSKMMYRGPSCKNCTNGHCSSGLNQCFPPWSLGPLALSLSRATDSKYRDIPSKQVG